MMFIALTLHRKTTRCLRSCLTVVAVLMMYAGSATCGIADEQSCANRVHKDCQCDIAHAPKSGFRRWCSKLQSCGECMAVPRCHSRYLDQYRSLLLTTINMSQKTSVCPNIQYRNLLKNIKASRKRCSEGMEYTDRCGKRCKCKDTQYRCYRVRKEFTQMSFDERRRYVDAFYKATTDPYYKDAFEELLNEHSRLPSKYLHHMRQIFLPWHRWYLLKIEDFLRQIDCRITIPYYQWTARTNHLWRTTDPKDVWNAGPQGLGGNGVPPSMCVQDGRFREGQWALPINKGGGCLQRDFNFSCTLYDQDFLKKTLQKNFTTFEYIVREKLHNDFHDCVGKLMHHHQTAGNTPEFLLHHSFIDKIWDDFQSKGSQYKFNEYYLSLNIRMPLAARYPWEYLDNNILPGDVCIAYQEFQEQEL